MQLATILLMVLASAWFMYCRGLRLLHLFQQEEYDGPRFLRWIIAARAFDRRGALIALPAAILAYVQLPALAISCAAAIGLSCISLNEAKQLRLAKKKLVMTQRARRIWWTALVLFAVTQLLAAVVGYLYPQQGHAWLLELLLFQLTPVLLVSANALLNPWEAHVQRGFLKEAQAKFERINPYVVGITGSYGKTSSKKILSLLLNQTLGPTFSTPGSINTPMGITRQIRENMAAGTKYAVIEMAAYRRGSIARLCALTPPQAALITNVGIMHLERFGSPDNVRLAKSELAQAVPQDGILVCNADSAGSLQIAREHPKRLTLLFGIQSHDADCRAADIKITPEGTEFKVLWRGQSYTAFTPQFGTASLLNILGAFTMACALGASPEYLLALLRTLPPEPNRLQVQRQAGAIWLHDAYSSNPAGFETALEVMRAMPGARRILITPGMVELGQLQAAENRRLATLAAKVCDLVFVVGATNREAWISGLQDAQLPQDRLRLCATRDEALALVRRESAEGDVVLIENDLPDLYEGKPSF